jgi:hypothetical protein
MSKRIAVVTGLIVVSLLCLAGAYADDPVPLPGLKMPETSGKMFLAALNSSPGVVLFQDATGEHTVFTRPAQNLTSFTFGQVPGGLQAKPGVMSLVFCNGISQKQIWRATSPLAEALLTGALNYIREVAFGPGGALYYSHSSGAGADGRILRLAGGPPMGYTSIEIAKVGGFWAGNFAFDPAGNLYVSNGNVEQAKIWRYPLGGAPPTMVFEGKKGSILGFCFTDATHFLYTDGSIDVLKGHIGGAGPDGVAYTTPLKYKFCDVVIR